MRRHFACAATLHAMRALDGSRQADESAYATPPPPSTRTTVPVMNPFSMHETICSAISSGLPIRFSGSARRSGRAAPSAPRRDRRPTIRRRSRPGDTQLTRTGASSSASALASASSAALMAVRIVASADGRLADHARDQRQRAPAAMRAPRATCAARQNLLSMAVAVTLSGTPRRGPVSVRRRSRRHDRTGRERRRSRSTSACAVRSTCAVSTSPSDVRAPRARAALRETMVTLAPSSTASRGGRQDRCRTTRRKPARAAGQRERQAVNSSSRATTRQHFREARHRGVVLPGSEIFLRAGPHLPAQRGEGGRRCVSSATPIAIPRSLTIRSRPKPASNLRDSTNCLNFFCVELFMPGRSVQHVDHQRGIEPEARCRSAAPRCRSGSRRR